MTFRRNRRKQVGHVTEPEWLQLAFVVSSYALVLGYIAAFEWNVPWLYAVAQIPGAVTLIAAHFHDWSTRV